MGTLTDAIEAAEERKVAAVGDLDPGMTIASEAQVRQIFLGWELDFEEFEDLSKRAGEYFAKTALVVPLVNVCTGAWTEGLLVGLMLASRVPE